jgi:hypothetical protein
MLDATFTHADQECYHLGAEIQGAVTCKLGVTVHGAEVRVHFLKSFQKGHICEILSKKGPKGKKDEVLRVLLDEAQAEQALWQEFRDHDASLNNALTEALRLHGGPSFRIFEVSVFA